MLEAHFRHVRSLSAFSWHGPSRGLRSISQSSIVTSQNHEDSLQLRKQKRPRLFKHYSGDEIIFSGIQPTGIPHLGNYLGALRQWKQFQDEKSRSKGSKQHRLLFSVVDLHALTYHQAPAELQRRVRETFASLMAIGLDPKYCSIFCQSSISQHAQLMWYLSQFASTGYLSRMTQWKSKLGVSEDATIEDKAARENLRLGLFSYPVLQAADILLYDTTIVPVGEDQEQHVEFTRNLARSFNAHFHEANEGKDFFRIPKALVSPAKRIMSLKDPTLKMSKSHKDAKSRILITDDAEEIHAKIKGALTDSIGDISYDPETRPGVSNLLEILRHVQKHGGDKDGAGVTCQELASDHANLSMKAFKEHVAQSIVEYLAGTRERYLELIQPGNQEISNAHIQSRKLARAWAGDKLSKLEALIGVRNNIEIHPRPNKQDSQAMMNREKIMKEQEEEQSEGVEEPDVLPQKDDGVNMPIAS